MKNISLILLLFIAFAFPAKAQNGYNLYYNFCGTSPDTGSSNQSALTDTSFYLVAGNTYTTGVSTFHTYLAAFDYNQNLLWKRYLYFAGKENEVLGHSNLVKLGTNKYVLAGNVVDSTVNQYRPILQPYIYIFDQNGDSISFYTWKDSIQTKELMSVTVDDNKNIYMAGMVGSETYSIDTNNYFQYDSTGLWIAKADSNGKLLWEKSMLFHSINNYRVFIHKIIMAHDNEYLYVTMTRSLPGYKSWTNSIVKADTSGNVVNTRVSHETLAGLEAGVMDIIKTSDGNYAFAGTFIPTWPWTGWPDTFQVYYGKFDDNLDTLWTKVFDDTPLQWRQRFGTRIIETKQRELFILGQYITTYFKFFALNTDSLGNMKGYREYMDYYDTIYTASGQHLLYYDQPLFTCDLTPDNRILMTGYLANKKAVSRFVLTDTFYCLTSGCQQADTMWVPNSAGNIAAQHLQITVYPNPADDVVHIAIGKPVKDMQLTLTDISGRVVLQQTMSGSKESLSVATFTPGIYILNLQTTDGLTQRYKIMKR